MNECPPVYFHVDLDAFFASVEQLVHPEYRGKPVIVGGLPGDRRAVVSTASYEARAFGVHSAMPVANAVKLCPDGIYVRGNMHLYHQKSVEVMEIFSKYSPTVLQMSVDEAFIDMTGTERLWGSPEDAAKRIKNEVKEKTGLTVSIGVAPTMYVAKIASGYKKPDGLTIIPDGKEEDFMLSLPLEKLWGVGTKTQAHLKNSGLGSIPAIHSKSLSLLQSIFGASSGSFLYDAVRGGKNVSFGGETKNHSVSIETTFEYDLTDRYIIETALMELASHLMYRLHREKGRSKTVALKIRYEDFTTVSIQETSDRIIMNTDDLFERCKRLFEKKYEDARGIRLLGIALENITSVSEPVQQELFNGMNEKKAKLEAAIYSMEDSHPSLKVRKARLL